MADEGKSKGGPSGAAILTTALVIGGIALIGWGGYKLVTAIFGNKSEEDKITKEELVDYEAELTQLGNLQTTIANQGTGPTAQQTATLNELVSQIQFKETHWFKESQWTTVANSAMKVAEAFGIAVGTLFVGIPLGYLVAKFLWAKGKKNPPNNTKYTDPKSGQTFNTVAELQSYDNAAYVSQTDAQILNQVQAEFQSMPLWYQAEVAAAVNEPAITSTSMSWGSLGSSVNWVLVAVAMAAAAATMGAAAPESAALLLVTA